MGNLWAFNLAGIKKKYFVSDSKVIFQKMV